MAVSGAVYTEEHFEGEGRDDDRSVERVEVSVFCCSVVTESDRVQAEWDFE